MWLSFSTEAAEFLGARKRPCFRRWPARGHLGFGNHSECRGEHDRANHGRLQSLVTIHLTLHGLSQSAGAKRRLVRTTTGAAIRELAVDDDRRD